MPSPSAPGRPRGTVLSAGVAVTESGIEQALAASIPSLARVPEPFRLLDADGRCVGLEPDLGEDELRSMYRWMVFGRPLDDRRPQLQRRDGLRAPEAGAGRHRLGRRRGYL